MAKLTKWDVQDFLKTTEDVMYYLQAALKDYDADFLRVAAKDSIKALKRIVKKEKNVTQEKQ